MNNPWNKFIYKIWSPMYDKIFNSGVFLNARKQMFQDNSFNRDQRILFVGVGTGADLDLINHTDMDIIAIDFSPDMLNKARKKFADSRIKFIEMDAQHMGFNNNSFDRVVGSLILSVVPDADKCFQEMKRVLTQDGKIIIFDKFKPKDSKLPLSKRFLRPLIKLFGTDIGLDFEKLYPTNDESLKIEEDKPLFMNGMYRKIVLRKTS